MADRSGEDEVQRDETATWTVQAGANGKWIDVSPPMEDHDTALETLHFRRLVGQRSVGYRLVRDVTVRVRIVEISD